MIGADRLNAFTEDACHDLDEVLCVEIKSAVGTSLVDGAGQSTAAKLSVCVIGNVCRQGERFVHGGTGASAAQTHTVFACFAHKGACILLATGDRLINEHGYAIGKIGLGVTVVIIAVTGGDHDAVHLSCEGGVIVQNSDAVGLVQGISGFTLLAVYADDLQGGVFALLDQLKEAFGMRVFAAENSDLVHRAPHLQIFDGQRIVGMGTFNDGDGLCRMLGGDIQRRAVKDGVIHH